MTTTTTTPAARSPWTKGTAPSTYTATSEHGTRYTATKIDAKEWHIEGARTNGTATISAYRPTLAAAKAAAAAETETADANAPQADPTPAAPKKARKARKPKAAPAETVEAEQPARKPISERTARVLAKQAAESDARLGRLAAALDTALHTHHNEPNQDGLTRAEIDALQAEYDAERDEAARAQFDAPEPKPAPTTQTRTATAGVEYGTELTDSKGQTFLF